MQENRYENTPPKSAVAYYITVGLAFLWLVLIFIGPFFHQLPEKMGVLTDIYYYFFHFTCHQRPERSYWLLGCQLPVCVRCLGIYIGVLVGLILFPLLGAVRRVKMLSKKWLFLAFLPIGIDGVSQVLQLYPSPHWVRLLTGLTCGAVVLLFVMPVFNQVTSAIEDKHFR